MLARGTQPLTIRVSETAYEERAFDGFRAYYRYVPRRSPQRATLNQHCYYAAKYKFKRLPAAVSLV